MVLLKKWGLQPFIHSGLWSFTVDVICTLSWSSHTCIQGKRRKLCCKSIHASIFVNAWLTEQETKGIVYSKTSKSLYLEVHVETTVWAYTSSNMFSVTAVCILRPQWWMLPSEASPSDQYYRADGSEPGRTAADAGLRGDRPARAQR